MSTESSPCPTCGYQMDRVEQMGTEIAHLRAENERLRTRLAELRALMPCCACGGYSVPAQDDRRGAS